MPQLDFANPLTIAQIIWMVVIFGLLYFSLSRWALPQVGRVLNDRATQIAGDLDGARIAKTEADAAAAEVRESNRRAHADAQSEINAAVDAAKRAASAQAAALNAALEARLVVSEQAIGQARETAMNSLRGVAAAVAGTMIERLAGHAAPAPVVDAAVDTALAQRAA